MERWKVCFIRLIRIVYGILFGWVWLTIVFRNTSFSYRTLFQLVLVGGWGLVLGTFLFLWEKIGPFCKRHKYKILLVGIGLIFGIQLVIGLQTVGNPMYDHGKVFWGASLYANGATAEELNECSWYLHHYTNNIGLFLLQQQLFRVLHWFGICADYQAAAIVGHLLFAVMLVSGFCWLDETFDTDTAFFYLFLAAMYAPVYFQSTVSYTDTWSIWCIPCTLLCMQRVRSAEALPKKLFWGVLTGVVLGVGMQIKVTVLIVAIAAAILMLVTCRKKENWTAAAATVFVVVLVCGGFRFWGRQTVIDPARAGEAMPATHWVMMGLQGDGCYNADDEWNITTPAGPTPDRVKKNIEVIRQRLQEMGPRGYWQLIGRKTCRTFGSGNGDMSYSYRFSDEEQPINLVYRTVFQSGPYYGLYNNLSHSFYLVLLLLGIVGAVRQRTERTLPQQGVLCLAMIGFWMFMMLWESNHRQLINQWPLFFMLGSIGLASLRKPLHHAFSQIRKKKNT